MGMEKRQDLISGFHSLEANPFESLVKAVVSLVIKINTYTQNARHNFKGFTDF